VYSLQVCEFVVIRIHAGAEEEASVSTVYDLQGPKLDEVGLVLLVSGRNEAVDLGSVVSRRWVVGAGSITSPFNLIFSSSL